ncbi:hypothetical protein GDO78_009890 [Eleutherodactylus coqui]|uniref:Uncharacterized protein n=1 Tax=Eleutherodactylus coqui TaxID=57060 RepID=A0A8J6FCE5_ELECQ|nr:hypothetical protein GDO78_009890 [Eleutherodactylus coqui]
MIQSSRKTNNLPNPFSSIQLFIDLSKTTMQARRNLIPITTALRTNKILYKWGFPTKLLIHKDGSLHIITNLQEGEKLLKTWGITTAEKAHLTPAAKTKKASKNGTHPTHP